MEQVLGWAASLVLIATLARQVHKQWRSGTTNGVSKWLFAGQVAASLLFTAYSLVLRNWVFVVTNAVLLINALFGAVIYARNRRRERRRESLPFSFRESLAT